MAHPARVAAHHRRCAASCWRLAACCCAAACPGLAHWHLRTHAATAVGSKHVAWGTLQAVDSHFADWMWVHYFFEKGGGVVLLL